MTWDDIVTKEKAIDQPTLPDFFLGESNSHRSGVCSRCKAISTVLYSRPIGFEIFRLFIFVFEDIFPDSNSSLLEKGKLKLIAPMLDGPLECRNIAFVSVEYLNEICVSCKKFDRSEKLFFLSLLVT